MGDVGTIISFNGYDRGPLVLAQDGVSAPSSSELYFKMLYQSQENGVFSIPDGSGQNPLVLKLYGWSKNRSDRSIWQ
jgi:hypothetical protein